MRTRTGVATGLTFAGATLAALTTWAIFAWTPIEATQGVIQRIYYVHIPVAWLAEVGFVMSALFGAGYLWLRDERADAAAVVSAEGGMYLATALLVVGPLWARVAWGTFWEREPRLTLTLLLYVVFIGYFMVRRAASDPDRARRYAAVIAIVGAIDIPADPHERVLVPLPPSRARRAPAGGADRRPAYRGDAPGFSPGVHAALRGAVVVAVRCRDGREVSSPKDASTRRRCAVTRAETFVSLALAVGWLAIAAWTFRIARKVRRLDAGADS